MPSLSFRVRLKNRISGYFERSVLVVLAQTRITPNILTLTGLGVAAVSATLIGFGWMLAAGIILLSSGLFDMLDGALARSSGQTSKFGALLDSTVDRASETVILLGIALFYLTEDSDIGIIIAFVAIIGSVLVSYVRARAEALDIECEVGLMTRAERVLTLSAGLVAAQWWQPGLIISLALTAAFSIATTIHRLLYAWVQLRADEDTGKDF